MKLKKPLIPVVVAVGVVALAVVMVGKCNRLIDSAFFSREVEWRVESPDGSMDAILSKVWGRTIAAATQIHIVSSGDEATTGNEVTWFGYDPTARAKWTNAHEVVVTHPTTEHLPEQRTFTVN